MLQEQQKLNCDFLDYPKFCMGLMGELNSATSGTWPEFTIHFDGSGRLVIMKESAIKVFNLLVLDFTPMPEDFVKQNITYR